MTYEDWCKHHKAILADADKWNRFRESAKDVLLTNIGPRIAKLGHQMYMGAGFHYSMEQQFGKLVAALALPWQPCANHAGKIEDEVASNIVTKVVYKGLLKQVKAAEKSAAAREWEK